MEDAQLTSNPEAEQKKIMIQNKYGEKLVGLLHETGSKEMVILCHGFLCRKEFNIMTNVAAALENEAVTVFRFDFSGNGESEGAFEFGNYDKEADDLHAVIQYFRGINRVTTAVLGHSKGGDVVLLYASKYHDVPAVVNVSGRYNLKNGLEDRLGQDFLQTIKRDGFIDVKTKTVCYRVSEESLMERLNTNMHEACLKIKKDCRVLTVHGSNDEVIPVEDAIEFSKIIQNHKLQIVDGADHGYTTHQSQLLSFVVPFILEGLQIIAT